MRGSRASLLIICIGAVVLSVVFFATRLNQSQHPAVPERVMAAFSNTGNIRVDLTATSTQLAPTPNLLTTQSEKGPAQSPTNPASYSPPVPPPVEPTAEYKNLPPETVLENMRTTLRLYLSTFGENPIGNNAEITRALLGENPKHISFIKGDDGNRVNSLGEIVDVWGTPYFFHQLSAHEMEIRSAGPDRKMWTSDDLVTE